MPYPPIYDEKLIAFIQVVYDSGLILNDYMSFLSNKIGLENDAIRVIDDTDDIDTLLAVLTYSVRQERVLDGLWKNAAENKIFLYILLKLRRLQKDSESDDKKEYMVRQLSRTRNKNRSITDSCYILWSKRHPIGLLAFLTIMEVHNSLSTN